MNRINKLNARTGAITGAVVPISVTNTENYGINGGAVLSNVVDGNLSTVWNPNAPGSNTVYNLTFTFASLVYFTSVTINIVGDTTHDPTSITFFTDSSKTTTVGSTGTMAGVTSRKVTLSTPYTGTTMHIQFNKTSQFQMYLSEVRFNI